MPVQLTQSELVAEIARQLVERFHPQRIYLFGSAARGECGPNSDLDFCIVLPDNAPEELYRPAARDALSGLATAVDLVRLPASDFDARAAHVAAPLPATVIREGRLLYDAR